MMDQRLLEAAKEYLPGASLGVHYLPENIRAVIVRGQGSRVYDSNGKEYIDCLLGSGPLLLGHAHPEVVEAVQRQASQSSTFYWLNEPAIQLAEKIVRAVPCGEALRNQLSGSEATFATLRIARAASRRKFTLKFAGVCHVSHALAKALVNLWPESRPPIGVRDT